MTTDTARWRKIREVLEAAMELSADERERFLDDACAGDSSLRAEVEGLLRHDARSMRGSSRFRGSESRARRRADGGRRGFGDELE